MSGTVPVAKARRRGFETLGDMARSLAVVLAVVGFLVLVTVRTGGQTVRLVDVHALYVQARIGAPFTLVQPAGLPGRWRPTSVYYNPPERTGVPGVTVWHVGYVTPADQYAGVEQTNGPARAAREAAITAPQPAGSWTATAPGTGTIGSVSWQRWAQPDGTRRALERTDGTVTYVVDGTAGWAELEQLAASLGPT